MVQLAISVSLLASRAVWRLDDHRQPIARTQSHHHLGLDPVTWEQAHLVALRHGRQDQLGFHHGKVVAKAHAWPTPKGKVGEGRTSRRALWGESLRIEALRFVPERGMTMHRIGADDDHTV